MHHSMDFYSNDILLDIEKTMQLEQKKNRAEDVLVHAPDWEYCKRKTDLLGACISII